MRNYIPYNFFTVYLFVSSRSCPLIKKNIYATDLIAISKWPSSCQFLTGLRIITNGGCFTTSETVEKSG
ncbi:hypothetical protein FORC31_p230 (plasmid) [Escherichia coli]|nr:hypothetical protein FORC31_p230 [Escherichia coli]